MQLDMRALEERARTGDTAAQFELAVMLDRAGKRPEATEWLETAATAGHTEALTLLAVADLQGLERPRDIPRARERLYRAVSLGGNAARLLLAVLVAVGIGEAANWSKAVGLVIDAARDGDYQALRQLALLVEMASPDDPIAADLLLRAGLKGDGLAAFAILRRQMLRGRTLATERAFAQWREGVVRIGHPLAARVANVIASPDATVKRPEGEPAWAEIERALNVPPGLTIVTPAAFSDEPYIRRFDNLLSVEECDYLIGLSSRYLIPAEVLDRTSGVPAKSRARTNSVAVLWPVHQDIVVHAINLRLAAATGLPPENGELTNILMYRPGEEYRAHFDFFPADIAAGDPSGQRIRTLLVYLNETYEGGETRFLVPGLNVKGDPGDAILFHNCDAATGAPDKSTLHAGLPVASGEKWLLSKWYREKTFVN